MSICSESGAAELDSSLRQCTVFRQGLHPATWHLHTATCSDACVASNPCLMCLRMALLPAGTLCSGTASVEIALAVSLAISEALSVIDRKLSC